MGSGCCFLISLSLSLNLSVVSIRTVLSQEMLVLDNLRCRLYSGIQDLGAACHLGNLLENHCVVNCVGCISSPGERSMVGAQNTRYVHRIDASLVEGLDDNKACVLLILAVDLVSGQASCAGNLAVEVVCVSGSVAGNAAACLCPGGSPRRMGMYYAANLRERLIIVKMVSCLVGRFVI